MVSFKKGKQLYQELIHSHATAEDVAQGFSLGVFISMTPILGLHTLLAIGLAVLLKKNKFAAAIGVWATNPITIVPIFYFTYKVGHLMMGNLSPKPLRPERIKDFIHLGAELLIPLWLGGLVVGLVSAIISYFVLKRFYPYMKKKTGQIKDKIEEKLHHP